MVVLLISLFAILALVGLQLYHTRFRNGLAAIPGPFTASVSNIWKVWALWQSDMPRYIREAHKTYGPVVRIGPNTVSFACSTALHSIYCSRDAPPKSQFYDASAPIYQDRVIPQLFSIRDPVHHHALKRSISSLYTKSAVQDFEPKIDRCCMLFVHRLQDLCTLRGGSARIDMALWPHFFALDSLSEINVSRNLGFLQTGTDVGGLIAKSDGIMQMIAIFSQAPGLQRCFMAMKRIVAKWKPNPVMTYSVNELEKRLKRATSQTDMLNRFLKLQEASPDKLSIQEVTGAIFINLMAGHDVLAITLRTILYHLARTPEVAAKLREELQAISREHPQTTPLPYGSLLQCEYLDAVIHEALRIHPNAGMMLERTVPDQGAEIDGYHIPGGTTVGVNPWLVNFEKDIFGDDVHDFRPGRWLDADADKTGEMRRMLFTFGAGSRGCIGRNLAMILIMKFIGEFYRRFEARLAEPDRAWTVHGSWITTQRDMDMYIKEVDGEKVGAS